MSKQIRQTLVIQHYGVFETRFELKYLHGDYITCEEDYLNENI